MCFSTHSPASVPGSAPEMMALQQNGCLLDSDSEVFKNVRQCYSSNFESLKYTPIFIKMLFLFICSFILELQNTLNICFNF